MENNFANRSSGGIILANASLRRTVLYGKGKNNNIIMVFAII